MGTMKFKAFENKLWLASPTMYGEERMYVKEAFDTNWVSTVGENLNQLEKGIAGYVGCKKSVALSSGTSALHLAVKLAGVKSGDRVFCSDMQRLIPFHMNMRNRFLLTAKQTHGTWTLLL